MSCTAVSASPSRIAAVIARCSSTAARLRTGGGDVVSFVGPLGADEDHVEVDEAVQVLGRERGIAPREDEDSVNVTRARDASKARGSWRALFLVSDLHAAIEEGL